MSLSKRRIKKRLSRKRRSKILFFGIVCLFLLVAGLFIFFVFINKKPVLLTPIPSPWELLMRHPSDKGEIDSLKLLLSQNKISYDTITVMNASYIIQREGNQEVILSSQKAIDEQISSLQLILSRLTMEGRHLKRLDLRFDKPVIVFM